MTIKELKTKIEDNSIVINPLILKINDQSSEFVAWQYIYEIANKRNLDIKIIDSYKDIQSTGFIEDNNLYVLISEEVTESKPLNCVILCKKCTLEEAIEIPKLKDWQFTDYLLNKVEGLNQADVEWLVQLYTTTYDRAVNLQCGRLENDLDKIALFDKSIQPMLFNEMFNNGEFDTISNITMFDLSNAIVNKDYKSVDKVLMVRDYIDLEPGLWLLSILLKSFRNLIGIQIGNETCEQLGISDKQYYFTKKNLVNKFTNDQLIKIYDMLTNIEYQFKFESLNVDDIIDYIIVKIFSM